MTREELTARLAECEGHEPGKWSKYYLHPHLASALRSAWAEIDRLKAARPNYGGWIEYLGVGRYTLHIEPPDEEE